MLACLNAIPAGRPSTRWHPLHRSQWHWGSRGCGRGRGVNKNHNNHNNHKITTHSSKAPKPFMPSADKKLSLTCFKLLIVSPKVTSLCQQQLSAPQMPRYWAPILWSVGTIEISKRSSAHNCTFPLASHGRLGIPCVVCTLLRVDRIVANQAPCPRRIVALARVYGWV